MGSCNLHKSQISGLDLIKYLSDQAKKFRLTPSGEIVGMQEYQHNARGYHQRFSAPAHWEEYRLYNFPILQKQ